MPSKKAIIEAVKEFFRVVVLAIIPILIDSITSGNFNWKIIGIAGAVAGLKCIDKLLHEVGVERESKGTTKHPIVSELTTGLTRF